MAHELDASGNPILRHKRPSPRTGTTGAGIQKFCTQQLKMFDFFERPLFRWGRGQGGAAPPGPRRLAGAPRRGVFD